jgi:hypothetical protein
VNDERSFTMKVLKALVLAAAVVAISDDGAGLDPHGGFGRQASLDRGCAIDPNGCPNGRNAPRAAADDDYSACLDPNGRCRGVAAADSDKGYGVDPNGVARTRLAGDYSACVDPNGRCRG